MDSRLTSSAVERRGTAKAGRKLLLHFRHFRRAGAQVPRRPWMAERGRYPWRSDAVANSGARPKGELRMQRVMTATCDLFRVPREAPWSPSATVRFRAARGSQ